MTKEQLEQMNIETKYGTFTPIFTYENFIFNEDTKEYEYIGLVIHKSAQEVYDEWLENKDKPPIIEEDKITVLEEKVDAITLENKGIQESVSTNTDMIFVTLDATAELNESSIVNTEMVLISMDALAEINEQLIALQDQINVLKGVK